MSQISNHDTDFTIDYNEFNLQDDFGDGSGYIYVNSDDMTGSSQPQGGNTGNINWPSVTGGIPQAGSGGLSAGGGSQPFTTISGGYYSLGTGGILTTSVNTIPTALKTDVMYIVVLQDGSCLELVLDNPITPREMIGVCMFINTVQMALQSGISVDWEMLINTLQIDRHFRGGHLDHSMYDKNSNVLYVKLFCT
jgi:hypothetical protein